MNIFIFILFLNANIAKANEFLLTLGHSFTQSNITGQNVIPTYKGSGPYGEVEYLMPLNGSFAVSIFGTYFKNTQENTANDNNLSEKLTVAYTGFGLKLYLQNLFLSGSLGRLQFTDKISGDNDMELKSNALAIEGGIGYRFKMSTLTGIVLGFNVLKATLDPANSSGIDDPYEFWEYRGNIAFNFILPSSPSATETTVSD